MLKAKKRLYGVSLLQLWGCTLLQLTLLRSAVSIENTDSGRQSITAVPTRSVQHLDATIKEQYIAQDDKDALLAHGETAARIPNTLFDKRHRSRLRKGNAWVPRTSGQKKKKGYQVLAQEWLAGGHGPDSQCHPRCTKFGVCNQQLGRCDCPRGFRGADCSQPPADMHRICKDTHFYHYKRNCTDSSSIIDTGAIVCTNACNGRGRCRAGWCHCDPGYWGADCSLSMSGEGKVEILAGMGYKPRQKRPLIYVYDLPPRLTTWRNPHFTDRPLHLVFWQRLLSAGVITANGEEADYFFFPMSVRGPSEGLLLEAAVDYVRTHWPWWNKHHGARHLIMHTGDTGRSELTGRTLRITANCTFLTHWGLYQAYPFSGWPPSHVPDRDIVIPIFMAPGGSRASGLQMSPHHPNSTYKFSDKKDIQLLFAGRICGGREEPDGTKTPNCKPLSKGYSQGVRQEIHQYHWNREGFRISVSNPNYFQDLTRTRFCLAPTGGGHGHRQILVAFSGCTPLIISDYVLQPFEPAMNWTRFALTIPQSSIPDLHNILPQIPEQRFEQMQAALSCAAQHFTWSSSIGGFMQENGKYDAFETTLEVLRMMVKYPGVPHAEFESRDPEFKAFMECRSDEYAASHPEAAHSSLPSNAQPNPLCSISKWDGQPVECEKCLMRSRRLPPGGALCCQHVDNLAACPRLWQ